MTARIIVARRMPCIGFNFKAFTPFKVYIQMPDLYPAGKGLACHGNVDRMRVLEKREKEKEEKSWCLS
jgi:hypothetical protein